MGEIVDCADGDAARHEGVEGTLVRRRRHARHLGDANAVGSDGDQVRKRTADLDADPHEDRFSPNEAATASTPTSDGAPSYLSCRPSIGFARLGDNAGDARRCWVP